jgi:hypothetical protein
LPPRFARPPVPAAQPAEVPLRQQPELPPAAAPALPQADWAPGGEQAPAPLPLADAASYETARRLSAAERAQRRLMKNLILGGLCLLILLVVGYWLAR